MKKIYLNSRKVLNQKERRQFNFFVLLGIITSIADILFLALLLWIIKFYIEPGGSTQNNYIPSFLADKESAWLIGVYFILFALKNMAIYIANDAQYRYSSKVAVRLSYNNLRKFQLSAYEEFVNIDSSSLIRKIALQPFEFSQQVLAGLQQMISQFFLVVLAVIAILLFNAKLFLLLLLILLPPVIFVFILIKRRSAITRKKLRDSNEKSYQYLLDALKGYVEGNVYGRNDFFMQRFLDQRKIFSKQLFGSVSLQGIPSRVIEIFAVLGLFILIVIAKSSGNTDTSTLITIGAFIAAAYKIIPGVVKIINLNGQVKSYEFDVSDFGDISETDSVNNKESLNSIAFKNISFSFPGLPVLANTSFSIAKGQSLGIKAASGKGKTSLLNLLLGFLSADAGQVIINGKNVTAKDLESWRYDISYVRQQSFFIYDSILRNVTLSSEPADEARLEFALKISGLEDILPLFPEGLEKVITENGKNISGGQQQRIALARCFYKSADLYMLDEAFNELDDESAVKIISQITNYCKNGKMLIVVSHDDKILSRCDNILNLD